MSSVAATSEVEALRGDLARHGYHLFLTPERPSGWRVTLRGSGEGALTPVEAVAPNRAAALALARSLFTSHRLSELDSALRDRGIAPPVWSGNQEAHLEALQTAATQRGIA